MLKIRLSRGGRKNLPFYRIVATNSTSPRDSKFLEKLGTYNPLLEDSKEQRITINKDRASYLFNSEIAEIENFDFCLLIGTNLRKDAPVLNSRLTKKSLNKSIKIAAIGVEADLTYKYDNLGNDFSCLEKILDENSQIAQSLKNAKNPALILGEDAILGENGAEIINISKKICEKYNFEKNFNFISKSTGLINGLEAGFCSKKTQEILAEIKNEKIKMVFLLGVDDDIDFEALRNSFVVYIGSHGDVGANFADIIIPAAAFSEKEEIYVNIEGKSQKTSKAISCPQNAKNATQIVIDIANYCDIDIGFRNLDELQQEIVKNHPNITKIGEINKANWQKSQEISTKIDKNHKIIAKDYDFYQTNSIARSSRILLKCSNEIGTVNKVN